MTVYFLENETEQSLLPMANLVDSVGSKKKSEVFYSLLDDRDSLLTELVQNGRILKMGFMIHTIDFSLSSF